MSIATAGIINQEWADLLKSWITGDRHVDYYLERRNTGINIPIELGDSDVIGNQLRWIDSITGLRFRETSDPNSADIFFTQVDAQFFDNPVDEGAIGYTEIVTNGSRNYFDIVYIDDEINDWDTQTDTVTVLHEIGHALGLTHPYGDGFNSNFTMDDTIMSYNPVANSTIKYQESDISALKYLWGEAGTNYDILTSSPTAPNEGSDSFSYSSLLNYNGKSWNYAVNKGDMRDKIETYAKNGAISGTEGNDGINLRGTKTGLTIKGLGGSDVISGGNSKDKIFGGRGSDYINAGELNNPKDKDKIYLERVYDPYEADVLNAIQKVDRIYLLGGGGQVAVEPLDGGIGIYDAGDLQAIYIGKRLDRYDLLGIVSSL